MSTKILQGKVSSKNASGAVFVQVSISKHASGPLPSISKKRAMEVEKIGRAAMSAYKTKHKQLQPA